LEAAVESLVPDLVAIGRRYGMEVQSCAEERDLSPYGVLPGACIDAAYIKDVLGVQVGAAKDPSQRPACRCVVSKDIGAYDTCLFGCRYCYATASRDRALANHARHDPNGTALVEP
jgi:hypothetical protein